VYIHICPGDGTFCAASLGFDASAKQGGIYISRDSGRSWFLDSVAGSGFWSDVFISGDGSTLTAGKIADIDNTASIYISRGLDANSYEIEELQLVGNFVDISSDILGGTITAVEATDQGGQPGFVYRSPFSGQTTELVLQPTVPPGFWSAVATVSPNGLVVTMAVQSMTAAGLPGWSGAQLNLCLVSLHIYDACWWAS